MIPEVLRYKRIHEDNTSAAVNTPLLLRTMRASIRRHQAARPPRPGEHP